MKVEVSFIMQSQKTRSLVYGGVFSALAIVLYFFELPIIPGLPYLKIDFSDLPAALAAVLLGPAAGVAVELIKNAVHLLIKGFGDTMGFGDLINFLVGSALVLGYGVALRGWRARHGEGRGARAGSGAAGYLLAGAAGAAAMAAAGVAFNFLIAPPYFRVMMHVELGGAALWGAIGGATVLNVMKSVVVAVLAVPLLSLAGRRFHAAA